MTAPLARILIVDSHPVVRRGVKLALEGQGNCSVVGEASTGPEALELARGLTPTIAIVEYSLLGLNGAELAFQVQSASPHTQILIYTTLNKESVILEALHSGARGFVMKSDPDYHLIAAVAALSAYRPYFSDTVAEVLLGRLMQTQRQFEDSGVTHREREIIQLIAEGRTNKEIADRLDLSTKTVETHRASVMKKLKLRKTAELVRYAVKKNIVEP